ncbi:Fe-S cluster assembly sulfur transfer protein SufU [Mycoplasmopsis gallopavonis]|uniref:Nitrogen fixation protein NIFU n=1 Tax=Mycoplasmopsis gallopavonis TaxID=76629 RepID=A0A449AZS5_9BACT|nr:SUF system NifU family Fe-S cluster assembly protein [Mycoplasmopsis gallopavonis]RIV16907.1 SUF system NifU family Fe-S cluster assembly protein [Mycoplasmopsis gallopavonis]VEU73013.1 nitrogen fixation protein NIFU [Mycoplasmopsis gallopavonis]
MHFNPNQAREIIMKHYMQPNNRENLDPNQETKTYFSNTCSDKLDLQLYWDGEILKDAKFQGNGCAIFVASTDIFLSLIQNKTKTEITELAKLFNKFVNQEELSQTKINQLENLWVFYNVKTHLNRVACATLTSNTFINEK